MNLTAIIDYEEVRLRHFLDALTITLALKPSGSNDDSRIIDVGSGAGIPGFPLKILMPNIRLVLLEAIAKKSVFLNHIKDILRLDDVEVRVGRAEDIARLTEYRESFDIVLVRAVAPLATLVELTLPFLAIDGRLIAQKKGEIDDEIILAGGAISKLGGQLREVTEINLDELPDHRRLVVIDKVTGTPEHYPRRPGVPAKRPIL